MSVCLVKNYAECEIVGCILYLIQCFQICEIAVCTQSHDEMIDLLRTSMTVKVVVVPPGEEGSPRR